MGAEVSFTSYTCNEQHKCINFENHQKHAEVLIFLKILQDLMIRTGLILFWISWRFQAYDFENLKNILCRLEGEFCQLFAEINWKFLERVAEEISSVVHERNRNFVKRSLEEWEFCQSAAEETTFVKASQKRLYSCQSIAEETLLSSKHHIRDATLVNRLQIFSNFCKN